MGQGSCATCGKRLVADTHAGSLTSYFFQGFNCRCGSASGGATAVAPKKGADKDFCKRCGLRTRGEERAGSITSFLFQDIRCKCTAEELFAAGAMEQKLWRLKQLDSQTFAPEDQFDEVTETKKQRRKQSTPQINLARKAIIGGTYRIVKLLGQGGMGEVYLAEHLFLNKKCALKVIPPDQVTEIGWLRFQAEAKTVAKLDHINLVKVSDLGIHESCLPYYAMEYVEGRTMADLLQSQGPMPLKTALDIFIQICDGLDYSHRHNIVHRDVKPANIMLSKQKNGTITVKVLDFGLVKLTQADRHQQSLTNAGELLGSPFYMSPEQCEGDRIDRRSDIYSLGCTLFESLVGRPPFDDSMPAAIVRNHLLTEAPSLEKIVGQGVFPDAIEVVIAKMLRKNPVERYQTMAELQSDLKRVARGENVQPIYVSRSAKVAEIETQIKPKEKSGDKNLRSSKKPTAKALIVWGTLATATIATVAAAALHFVR